MKRYLAVVPIFKLINEVGVLIFIVLISRIELSEDTPHNAKKYN